MIALDATSQLRDLTIDALEQKALNVGAGDVYPAGTAEDV